MIYPNFHTYFSIGRICFGKTIIYIRPQSMEGNIPFTVFFVSGDLGAAQSSGNQNFYTLCSCFDGPSHCLLHGSSESYSFFQCLGYAFCCKLGIEFSSSNFFYIDGNPFLCHFFKFPLELFDPVSGSAYYHTGFARQNDYPHLVFCSSFNDYS